MATDWNQYTPQAGASPWTFLTTGPAQGMANPYATALPSGEQVTGGATTASKNWLNQLQSLFNSTNSGKNLFAEYNAPSWSDPAYRREMATRRQYLADDTTKNALNYAKQARNLSQMRGGYGVRGAGGSAADILGASYAATQANRQAQLQQLYNDYRAEQEAARSGAIQGFQGALGGIGTALGAYNTAAANQAAAMAAAAQSQLAERKMIQDLYMAGLNQAPAWQEQLQKQMAALQLQQAYQAQMDKQSAAQTLQRYYTGGLGGTFGLPITDAGREQQFALQKMIEQALIAQGVATPVQRKQDMNQVLGYGSGNQQPASATMLAAKGGYYY